MNSSQLYHCIPCQQYFTNVEKRNLQCPFCKNNLLDLNCVVHQLNVKVANNESSNQINVYSLLEREFGRPLSPMEIEELNFIEQEFPYDFIKLALREASMAGVLKLAYIDRILRNWKRNNIKTLADAIQFSKNYRSGQQKKQQQKRQQPSQPVVKIPFYNWLEN